MGTGRGVRRARTAAALLLTLAGLAASTGLAGGASTSPVVPASQRVAGKTYTQWMVASWQWNLAFGHSGVNTTTHGFTCTRSGQRGKVWFLQDEYEGDAPITVTCELPAARYLFLEGPTFECSTVEPAPFAAARPDLPRCARRFQVMGAQVIVDGATLKPPAYLLATPPFHFAMPASNNVLGVAGKTQGYSAARGYATILRPLAAGAHTIVQRELFAGGKVVETTWKLKVR